MSTFEEFCGNSSFWDDTGFSDNSTYPNFTKCFRNTVLVWLPCGWLWLTLPVNIYLVRTTKNQRLPVTAFNMSKLILVLILVVMTVIDTVREVSEENLSYTAPNVVIVTGLINAVSYGLAAVYTQLDRIRGSITSTSLFVFWLLKVVCNIVDFYTRIVNHTYEENLFRFILFYIIYSILLVQLILHSFAEKQNIVSEDGDSRRENCPEEKASILNLLYFWWMNSIIVKAYKKPLVEKDLWPLMSRDQSQNVVKTFDSNWRYELSKAQSRNARERTQHVYDIQQSTSETEKTPLLQTKLLPTKINVQKSTRHKGSLFKALFNSFGWTYLLSLWFKFISDILQFVGPILISFLIAYADDRDNKPSWKGYLPAVGLFVSGMIQSVFYHQNYKLGMAVGMRVRCSLISAIYKKSLTMNSDAKKETTLGQIVSLMSVDCQHLQDMFTYLSTVMSVPVQVAIGMYLLWGTLGISCLAGLGVLLLLIPLNSLVAARQLTLTADVLALKGERIKLMNQILNGMKVLKMYAWEPSFTYQVSVIRRRELDNLMKVAYLQGVATFGWLLAPFVVALATFATYVNISDDKYLSASKAFVSLALFNILRLPVILLAQSISAIIQGKVSLKRVGSFLSSEDLDPSSTQHVFDTDYAIKIQRGTFTWDKENPQSTLRDINLTIPDGQLVAVVGHVGAGKSSLFSATLGEMLKIDGSVALKGSVAYVPQEAWIQNATLMDNILFGKTFMQKKYKRVLEACAMTSDLDLLPGRDLTEIGEKGINLSGGQKQRVSLARAVYSNSDVYLMDDPLSAVDAHVGKHIFEKVIGNKGLLKNKTRLLVTHGIHWLPMVDHIIVMTNGRITEVGTYEDLINHDGPFAHFLKQYFIEENDEAIDDPEIQQIRNMILEQVESVTSDGLTSDEPALSLIRKQNKEIKKKEYIAETPALLLQTRLTHDEQAETGGVKWPVYKAYTKALGLGASIIVMFVFSMYHAASVYANFWLTFWTNDQYLTNQNNTGMEKFIDQTNYYLLGYGVLGIIQAAFVLIYATLVSVKMVQAAGKIHQHMLDKIMRAPMGFFDTTPLGRIINRFSSDVEMMDTALPLTFRITLNSLYLAVTTVIVICINTPIILSTVVPLMICYGVIMRFYLPTSRQLKRLESIHRSPVFNHFSETIAGAIVIRAYKASERFMNEALKRLDKNMVYYYAFFNSARWLGIRLELLGNIFVIATALFSIYSDLDGSFVGLSVVYAIQATYILNLLVINMSDLQSNIVCVERIKEYTEIDSEANWRSTKKPPDNWPEKGEIIFTDFRMRYRAGTELVLHGINLKIHHGEKIGIVGRTGAGKSSLALALFRLIEAASGDITIDGVDIKNIGLHDLREKVTILPQDPVLFSGSLRLNLDPFCCYGDDQLWTALEHAHLRESVNNLPGKLDFQCGEGGQNLSVGQRQLVCLARTLLKETRVLVLDEATAAVDLATDDLIQQTIFREFKDCTVLAIAHRLKTVLDYDRIVVMDKGRIVEVDNPNNLLANEKSIFYGLAKEAGIVNNGNGQEQLKNSIRYLTNQQPVQNVISSNRNSHDNQIGDVISQKDKEDNMSEKSSNGWSSYSGRSGNEGSAELSNGQRKDVKHFVDNISVDSVRFGDVTIVTPQQILPPSLESEISETTADSETGSEYGESKEELEDTKRNDSGSDKTLKHHVPVKQGRSLESSLNGSESKGSSEKSEYYSADSQCPDELLNQHLVRQEGEATQTHSFEKEPPHESTEKTDMC
ncbi:multidrug resistance-associated protein 1-like [Mytilus edulis]|uniref:multidrug resistance-associated protein 1-like n=1 Tax=Mytilus edulis TaxID=6550 RepID=UPI0039F0ACFE